MTTDEYIAKQKRAFSRIIEKDEPLRIAARDTMAKQATRIFVEGKNSNEVKIGDYNATDEIYVNPNTSAGKKFSPAGKAGKERNITDRKTKWFESYKDYREEIGRKTDKVDLFLSGDLKSDFGNSGAKEPNGKVKPRQNNVHEYVSGFSRETNALKAEGMEDHFEAPIFTPSASEKKSFFSISQKEFQRILLNA